MPADRRSLPFLAAILGIALFSLMDAFMKNASLAVGAYSAMLVRSAFGVVVMLPLWKLAGGAWPARAALRLHALRGTISAGMAITFFWGLIRLPLAEAIALSFIAPLIALYLAAALLGERIEQRAVLASLLGLAGVLVIGAGRIGAGRFGPDAAWGIGAILVSAVLYAFNLILQRKQALLAGPREVTLFQMGFTLLILALFAPWFAVLPDARAAGDIFVSALLAAAALMLLSWAYGKAETQALIPIEYTAFVWAALLGWAMFAEAVTGATLAGAGLIVLGCWLAARQSPAAPGEQTAL
ncbi:MAG: DMT family transporter [Novosphingobium sp.]